jgi:hypothetical protein
LQTRVIIWYENRYNTSLLLLINVVERGAHFLDAADLRPRHVGIGSQLSTHPNDGQIKDKNELDDFHEKINLIKEYFSDIQTPQIEQIK